MSSALRLADIFQDHAVIQRDVSAPIWGRATPGARVTVELAGFTASAETSANGDWFLRFPPLTAGGPHELIATSSATEDTTVTLRDILIGEVWIGSGQSNMEWRLLQCDPQGTQSAGVNLPQVRLLTVSTPTRSTAITTRWASAKPETLAAFSAIGGWFGRTLNAELGVPVGIIVNAWGGTRIQTWLSREALMLTPEGRAELAAHDPAAYSHARKGEAPVQSDSFGSPDEWFRARGPEDPVDHGVAHGWHLPAAADSDWPIMTLPTRWQDAGHNFNGIVWFRHRVALPPALRGRTLRLQLGAIDKHDDTYVNGIRVGGMSWENPESWCTPRDYLVPADIVGDAAELVVAVRVRAHIYHGGMTGPAECMRLFANAPVDNTGSVVNLSGDWPYKIEQNWGVVTAPVASHSGPGGHNAPHALHDARLYPLIPYAIRGFLWYQGESNSGQPSLYRRLMPLLIEDWRRVWGQGELPFILVQLAGYETPNDWPALRAAQAAALALPGVGLATAIDVGDPKNIHPANKKTVGLRLARWALAEIYSRGGPPGGPLFVAATSEGASLRLHFHHAEGLRTADGGAVAGLELSPDGTAWLPARSRIEGETLVVSHPDLTSPAHARYAWRDYTPGLNLINAAGLPAYPFNTTEPLN